jgi:hypothetical protein
LQFQFSKVHGSNNAAHKAWDSDRDASPAAGVKRAKIPGFLEVFGLFT